MTRATSCPSPRRDAAVGVIPDDQSDARKACEDVVEGSASVVIVAARSCSLAPPSCKSTTRVVVVVLVVVVVIVVALSHDTSDARNLARGSERTYRHRRVRILPPGTDPSHLFFSAPRAVYSRAGLARRGYRGVGVAGGRIDPRTRVRLALASGIRSARFLRERFTSLGNPPTATPSSSSLIRSRSTFASLIYAASTATTVTTDTSLRTWTRSLLLTTAAAC